MIQFNDWVGERIVDENDRGKATGKKTKISKVWKIFRLKGIKR